MKQKQITAAMKAYSETKSPPTVIEIIQHQTDGGMAPERANEIVDG